VKAGAAILALAAAANPQLRAWMRATPRVLTVAARARPARTSRSLTIFRMGLGRDSIAMLCLLVEDGILVGGERIHPADVDAVVFTDPGAEWRQTYALIKPIGDFCDAHGLRFIVQAKPEEGGDLGWRQWVETRQIGSRAVAPWRSELPGDTIESRAARGYYHARAPIMADYASKGIVVMFADPSCTVNHKIGPNRAMIDDLARERFGEWAGNAAWSHLVKKGERPPHRVLLGIAADEEERLEFHAGPAYEANFYPLAEMGIRKSDEGPILERHGFGAVRKSGCVMCKFQPIEWYWALSMVDPAKFAEVATFEANALTTSPNLLLFPKGVPPSNGYAGDPRPGKDRLRLPVAAAVAYWRELNPTATVDRVLSKAYGCERVDGGKMKNPSAREAFARDVATVIQPL
jgi:hypothetical protein